MTTPGTARPRSPKLAREAREKECSGVVGLALSRHPDPDVLLAEQLATRPKRIAAWRSPESGESMPIAHVVALADLNAEAARAIVGFLAGKCGRGLRELGVADGTKRDLLREAGRTAKEGGEAVAAILDMASREHATDVELDGTVREIREAIEALTQAEATLLARKAGR